uniref:ATP-dependent DNA helicase n=1 Tax=Tanacetum cinerariifolium TaxID=118510 RepID=A0A6L2MEX3_TANCI|nr:DNA helicase [Tanacetum cinerariifolium]
MRGEVGIRINEWWVQIVLFLLLLDVPMCARAQEIISVLLRTRNRLEESQRALVDEEKKIKDVFNIANGFFSCFMSAIWNLYPLPSGSEPRIQTVDAVDVAHTTNRNCVPLSTVFNRFRNMRPTSGRAEYTSQTVDARIQRVAAVDITHTTDRNCVPLCMVFDRFRNMRPTNGRAKYRSQTVDSWIQRVAAVDITHTTDRNCVPLSMVFDRFRNMRPTSGRAEYTAQTASCSRTIAAIGSKDRGLVYTPVVPVSKLPEAALADLAAITRGRTYSTQLIPNISRISNACKLLEEWQLCVAHIARKNYFKEIKVLWWHSYGTWNIDHSSKIICHPYISYDDVCHALLGTFNHVYLCLDSKDCIIRPEIITFPNTAQKTRVRGHETIKYPHINDMLPYSKDILTNATSQTLLPTLTHAYFCLDVKNAVIRPLIIRFPRTKQKHTRERSVASSLVTKNTQSLIITGLEKGTVINSVVIVVVYFGTTSDSKALNTLGRLNTIYVVKDLYIYDTRNEVRNRMQHFSEVGESAINPEIIQGLIHVMDEHNGLVKLFRTVRDKCITSEIPAFKIRLYNISGVRGYELSTADLLRAMVLPRIAVEASRWHRQRKKVTMNAFYRYQLHPQLTPADRADVVCRVFEQKVKDFLTFERSENVWRRFCRGLSHFHTLMWVDSKNERQDVQQIDNYISAEIPDSVQDPRGYKLVTELMMHGPYGAANSSALCIRDTGIHVMKGESGLDNYDVVPYNHALCLAFEAHINVEYYGWIMLIKYLFKYISKGPNRIIAKINSSDESTTAIGSRPRIDEIQNYIDEVQTVNGQILPNYRAACEALSLLGDDKEWDTALEESTISATSKELMILFSQILIYCDVADPLKLWIKYKEAMGDDIPAKISRKTKIPNFHVNTEELQGYILYELEKILNSFGKSVTEFGLQAPPQHLLRDLENKLLIKEKHYKRDLLKEDAAESVPKLNRDQRKIFDLIISASMTNRQELLFAYGHGGTGKTFLWRTIISSLRSQGKTNLAVASLGIASLLLPAGRTTHSRFKPPLELIDKSLCYVKKKSQLGNLLVETDLIILDEAPMNDKRCFETLDMMLRDLMSTPNVIFRGKTIVLGGDFSQTLPVKKGASKEQLIAASIAESYLWPHFKVCMLKENMRLLRSGLTAKEKSRSEQFAKWLLDVGNGEIGEPDTENEQDSSWVTIPP